MEDLINELTSQAGLTEAQALAAVQVMKTYIHSKVPPMFAGFVDSFFAGNAPQPEADPLA